MKKILLPALAVSLLFSAHSTYATPSVDNIDNVANLPKDSTDKSYNIEQIVIRSSSKETNDMWRVPGAVSLINPGKANYRGIESVKDLSVLVPNLFIPDYGSKMTTPIYLRGVGTRSSGQAVSFYVDNIPYMDKSSFDFELMDIQRIEVLRGPQGTLYGRNAMGGVVNIYTLSPFDFQGTKISVSGGNYGNYSAKASHYSKLSNKVALSVGGYYERMGGYFTNEFTGEKVDDGDAAGARIKLDWRISPRLTASLASSYDYVKQGAFAYGLYDKTTGAIAPVNYNDEGSYKRQMSNNSLRFEYRTDKILLTSNTGYQYLNDDMKMDQDFTPLSIFTINQRQLQNSINQEIAIRSNTTKNYQWSVGAFAFYNALNTDGDVLFKKDGIATILQPVFDKISQDNPRAPKITITDTEIPNPGTYKTPTTGVAIFHQSTFNNLFTRGLSVTLGLRLDYEKQFLNYNTHMNMNTEVSVPNMPRPMPFPIGDTLNNSLSQEFLQILPKVSIKYECTPHIMTYASVSKGHKSGGYNIQMFSEVIQNELKNKFNPKGERSDIAGTIAYKPEVTWNYEVGARAEFLEGALITDLALFYMDIRDVQLTQFVNGGSGRILTNAGRGKSLGVEFSLNARIAKNLHLDLNYGYTHATFTEYDGGTDSNGGKVDYKGKFIPYTPQHTFSVGALYNIMFNRCWLDQVTLSASYSGAGKIYWTEQNDFSQPFYGLLDAKVTLRHSFVRLELWGRNLLSTSYGAFYFESFGNSFMQRGKPLTFGGNLVFTF